MQSLGFFINKFVEMRGANQNTNFVAEFAAKRAAQLERARQLREERKKVNEVVQDRPASGSPMTYARSNQVEEVGRPMSASIGSVEHEREEFSHAPTSQQQKRGAVANPAIPTEVSVTEDDFRRAVKQGVITPDQARQLWSVLSDPSSGAKLDSFKKAQPSAMSYDPARYEADGNSNSYTSSKPYSGLETKKPPIRNAKPEWNSSFEPSYQEEQPSWVAPSATGSKKVAGASYAVRHQSEWNSNPEYEDMTPAPVRSLAKKPQQKVSRQPLPEWNSDYGDRGIPSEPAALRKALPPTSKQSARQPSREEPVSAPMRAQPSKQAGRAPPPPPPPQEDVDEVEEFQRLKEEQARQFEEALQEAEDGSRLVPCQVCGRTFRETIISRHELACRKANKKRKTFDMTKARLDGIDGAEEVLRQQKRMAKNAPSEKPAGKIPKWKLQHQQFQAVLKINKGGASAMSGPPIPMPDELDDRVPCPHCGRKFATETAERHIPKCSTTINKPKSLARPIRR